MLICWQMETQISMFDYVLAQLEARKGSWPLIAKAIEPDSWESYYSWLTKLAQGRIPDPSVNKIQVLFDRFQAEEPRRKRVA